MIRRLVFAASLLASACATSGKESMRELKESVETYNEAFRWQNFEGAAAHLPNDLRAAFISTHEDRQTDLRIESFRILKVDIKDEQAAEVTVTFRYTLLPSIIVESRKVVQHWHRVNDRWVLESEDNAIIEVEAEAPRAL